MEGVREYAEGRAVVIAETADGRPTVVAENEAGHNNTQVDLIDLLAWVRANRPELLRFPAEVRPIGVARDDNPGVRLL
jgi:hypothetical protein